MKEQPQQPIFPISDLPSDLILEIFDYAGYVTRVCLALSTRRLYEVFKFSKYLKGKLPLGASSRTHI
jgi:hypothetical protein